MKSHPASIKADPPATYTTARAGPPPEGPNRHTAPTSRPSVPSGPCAQCQRGWKAGPWGRVGRRHHVVRGPACRSSVLGSRAGRRIVGPQGGT